MANICLTYVTITCVNEAQASEVIKCLKDSIKQLHPSIANNKEYKNTYPNWLGNVALYLGATVEDIKNISVRGSLNDIFASDSRTVELALECAWTPALGFIPFLGNKFQGAECYYYGYEPAMSVFCYNSHQGHEALKNMRSQDFYDYNIESDEFRNNKNPLFYKPKEESFKEYIKEIEELPISDWF